MEDKETGRLEAFSDGVFAVAITLLVLDIKIPTDIKSSSALLNDLWEQRWTFSAFIVSFFFVGIMWMNHHRLFTHIRRTNTGLMLLNLLLLFFIVLTPVPTALLAEHWDLASPNPAAIVYGGTFFLMACCFNFLWFYASYHNRLLGKDVDKQAVAVISRRFLFGPISYLIALGLAFINAPASLIFQFILALFYALPGQVIPDRRQPPKQ
ncbi:MAG TPA: TMEM175 family protein [Ktedonobacteraceae bacterium]|nr:TMEM175 family protein [Ktedonobacteraceae bacterium]